MAGNRTYGESPARSSVPGLTRIRTVELPLAIPRYSARSSDCRPIYRPVALILLRERAPLNLHFLVDWGGTFVHCEQNKPESATESTRSGYSTYMSTEDTIHPARWIARLNPDTKNLSQLEGINTNRAINDLCSRKALTIAACTDQNFFSVSHLRNLWVWMIYPFATDLALETAMRYNMPSAES